MIALSGSVDRIVFRNPDNGYCVARFQVAPEVGGGEDTSTIVGTLPAVQPGEVLQLSGEWHVHPLHGRTFHVERFEPHYPTTLEGIERYLGSGAVRGIGPVTASRIVEQFGDRTLEVLERTPELLQDVPGLSPKRIDVIRTAWAGQQELRQISVFLQSHGVSIAFADRILEAYGERAIELMSRDPYQLAHDIRGIGFRTADSMAATLGISRQSLSRYVAGLHFVLSESLESGHVFLHRSELLRRGSALLSAPAHLLEPALLDLLQRGLAVLDDDAIYLAAFYQAETGIVRLVGEILEGTSALTLDSRFDVRSAVRQAGEAQGLQLARAQIEAAEQALRSKVSILTGGPGTGKTSTLRTIITALERADISYCLCAPTGRAAKRVAETTSRSASTIHRLLEFQPGISAWGYDQARPLPYDFVIVDEVSMLDTILCYHLLKAVPRESHVLLVGDADQLPSVGPGNVLHDLLSSQVIPTTRLTELFRQAQGSQIVVAAHSVNRGEVPSIANGPDDDLFFVQAPDDDTVVNAIKILLQTRIPKKFGFDPVEDVQVLAPMHAGSAGVAALNRALQELLNPLPQGGVEVRRGERSFRVGDKIMQMKNNYELDVFNGDMGRIVALDAEEQRLTVAYPSLVGPRELEYTGAALDQLVLGYAVSVHKAQGSEFAAVIMPVVPRHAVMMRRNLLYTAITRARRLCVLVGSDKSLAAAVHGGSGVPRNTRLAARLAVAASDSNQPVLAEI